MDAINAALDSKLDQLATRIEAMVATKIEELERKFQNVQNEVKKLKDDVDDSINHVESVLKYDIDCVWDYALKNEQYSRKNNLRVFGLKEEDRENLEEKFITSVRDHLKEDITSEEINYPQDWAQKNKMKILLKRKLLKAWSSLRTWLTILPRG